MERVGFIGACNKTNLIMYVAKAIASMNKKVLVVDAEVEQRTKYIVPSINPTKSYIVEFEKIDFAVGFENMKEIERYLGVKEETMAQQEMLQTPRAAEETGGEIKGEKNGKKTYDKLPYDYVLMDLDSCESVKNFDVGSLDKNYFVTSFDVFSLVKGLEILADIKNPLKLTKVLYSYDMNKEDEEYLNHTSMGYKVIWNEVSIYLPKMEEDNQVIEENQRVYRIRIKKLSQEYQDGIIYIAQDILKEKSASKLRKSIKE